MSSVLVTDAPHWLSSSPSTLYHLSYHLAIVSPQRINTFPPLPYFSDCDMSNQPGPSRFRVLFETALRDYDRHTGVTWVNHCLAERLDECTSVESVSALLQEQARSFSEPRGDASRIMKPLKRTVSILYTLSSSTALGEAIGMVRLKLLVGVPSL